LGVLWEGKKKRKKISGIIDDYFQLRSPFGGGKTAFFECKRRKERFHIVPLAGQKGKGEKTGEIKILGRRVKNCQLLNFYPR